jgi:hypothetical protein
VDPLAPDTHQTHDLSPGIAPSASPYNRCADFADRHLLAYCARGGRFLETSPSGLTQYVRRRDFFGRRREPPVIITRERRLFRGVGIEGRERS